MEKLLERFGQADQDPVRLWSALVDKLRPARPTEADTAAGNLRELGNLLARRPDLLANLRKAVLELFAGRKQVTMYVSSGLATTAQTAGTNRAISEALLKTVLQAVYTTSGDFPSVISLTPSHKGTFSGFAGIAANRYQVPKGKQGVIVGGADVYMSDFGELTAVPNYVQATANANAAFILNPEYAGIAYLGDFKSEALSKTGHTDKELVSAEACLVVTAEVAHGAIKNLTA